MAFYIIAHWLRSAWYDTKDVLSACLFHLKTSSQRHFRQFSGLCLSLVARNRRTMCVLQFGAWAVNEVDGLLNPHVLDNYFIMLR